MTISNIHNSHTSTGPPFVLTEDAGQAEGDLIVAFGGINSIDGVWTLPGDFIPIDQFSETVGSTSSREFIAYKVRGATAGDGYSFSYDGTAIGANVGIVSYRGTVGNLGLDVTYVKASHYHGYTSTTNDYNAAAAEIITETAGAMCIICQSIGGGPPDTYGPPTGWNQRGAAAGTHAWYCCDRINPTPGTETPLDFTHVAPSPATGDQRTFIIAIAELAAGGIGRLGGIDDRFNSFIR